MCLAFWGGWWYLEGNVWVSVVLFEGKTMYYIDGSRLEGKEATGTFVYTKYRSGKVFKFGDIQQSLPIKSL